MEHTKEYKVKCQVCGLIYRLQATQQQLERYPCRQRWMCEQGRHVEPESIGQYLEIIGESEHLGDAGRP